MNNKKKEILTAAAANIPNEVALGSPGGILAGIDVVGIVDNVDALEMFTGSFSIVFTG
jgi:hypothetical protein